MYRGRSHEELTKNHKKRKKREKGTPPGVRNFSPEVIRDFHATVDDIKAKRPERTPPNLARPLSDGVDKRVP